MEKIILVDGNNLLFRSYYATAYTGNFMKNSKGFPTNGLFGFTNMINKIIDEEKPVYMIVAFDKGKTFRHSKFDFYKQGRSETPNELKMQFPLAKELLTYMGIKYYEIENYEADDIIGTFSKYCNEDDNYQGLIVSSDKDLLQLITENVEMKLLKSKDYIRYSKKSFIEEYKIDPIKIIDLKSLMGDQSDNIPGVKGIGEKTALKLLCEYGSLDGIYENIENIKGAAKQKLIDDKENAYISYELATIVTDVNMDINLEDIKYKSADIDKLNDLYKELEFNSFLKRNSLKKEIKKEELKYEVINNINDIHIDSDVSIYLEILGHNYHTDEILGMGVYNDKVSYFIPVDIIKQNPDFLTKVNIYTYDMKKVINSLKSNNIDIKNIKYDAYLAGHLLDYNVKEDISYLASYFETDIAFYDTLYGKTVFKKTDENIMVKNIMEKVRFIHDSKNIILNKIKEKDLTYLYEEIEMKLAVVLADMEFTGINVSKEELLNMKEIIDTKIDNLTKEIYDLAECEFNIASPKQLAEILFEKLGLENKKKGSTAIDVLTKLKDKHSIIQKIIDYRTIAKIKGTYVDGIINRLKEDKIHTIYTQTLTRTGRLSSVDPNLQNIPTRYEEGRLVKKAFISSKDSVLISSDYSQIELRILASMANVPSLIDAFKEDKDIHSKTASDIFKINIEDVTKKQRSIAKAVNFGIIYGISAFGLSENTGIYLSEAKEFITKYFETYPGIKEYMDNVVKNAYKNGYVTTLMNRKRVISELSSTNYLIRTSGERMALNTPIQGTSADIIKKAMIEIYDKIKVNNLKSKMILQVHDELIFDVKNEEIDMMKKIIKDTMENTYELKVPLKVELAMDSSWYNLK